jgi:phasin
MNEHIKRQTEEFMNAAKAAKIPENIQALAEEGVSRSKEAFDTLTAAAKEQAKAAEDLALATQANLKTIGSKLFDNTAANAEAAFDAARSIARAGSVPEALRLQVEFVQRQFSIAGAQAKELFELSASMAKQTLETANDAAVTAVEKARKRA